MWDRLSLIQGGMDDGSHWSDGFKGKKFKDFYQHAKLTDMKSNGSQVQAAAALEPRSLGRPTPLASARIFSGSPCAVPSRRGL